MLIWIAACSLVWASLFGVAKADGVDALLPSTCEHSEIRVGADPPFDWEGETCYEEDSEGNLIPGVRLSGQTSGNELVLGTLTIPGRLSLSGAAGSALRGEGTILQVAKLLYLADFSMLAEGVAWAACLLDIGEYIPEDLDPYIVQQCEIRVLNEDLEVDNLVVRGGLIVPGDPVRDETLDTYSIEAASSAVITGFALTFGHMYTPLLQVEEGLLTPGFLGAGRVDTGQTYVQDGYLYSEGGLTTGTAPGSAGPLQITGGGVSTDSVIAGAANVVNGRLAGFGTDPPGTLLLRSLSANGATISGHSLVVVEQDVSLTHTTMSGTGSMSARNLTATTDSTITGHDLVDVAQDIDLSTTQVQGAGGAIHAGRDLSTTEGSMAGHSSIRAVRDINFDSTPVEGTGEIIAGRDLSVTSPGLFGHTRIVAGATAAFVRTRVSGAGAGGADPGSLSCLRPVPGWPGGPDNEIVAQSITSVESQFLGHAKIHAESLSLDRDDVLGWTDELALKGTDSSTIRDTEVCSSHIVATLGDGQVLGSSLLSADRGGGAPRAKEAQEGDHDLWYHTGASYGGYGGSEGSLVGHDFRPADEQPPEASPRVVLGEGPGGYGVAKPGEKGGVGGGFIEIDGETLWWDGKATAAGGDAEIETEDHVLYGGGGGGSGGSIHLDIDGDVSGSGTFHTNGGNGSFGGTGGTSGCGSGSDGATTGGGGSGGRIVVLAGRFARWDGQGESIGGRGGAIIPCPHPESDEAFWRDWRNHGGPGTTYMKADAEPGLVIIDGAGLQGDGYPGAKDGLEEPDRPGLGRGVGELSGAHPGDAVLIRHATVVTDGLAARSLTLEQAELKPDNPRTRLYWPIPLVSFQGTSTWVGSDYPGWVWRDPLDESLRIDLEDSLIVDRESSIDLSGWGKPGREGLDGHWVGGSNGGLGGVGRYGGTGGEPTAVDGVRSAPVLTGEGGTGTNYWSGIDEESKCALGGAGGGALRLIVGTLATVQGRISVDGAPGTPGVLDGPCSGERGTSGGAGGSIWLTVPTLAGEGKISARGGDGAYDGLDSPPELDTGNFGGGGGGGRIAIDAGTVSPTLGFAVAGGDGGHMLGTGVGSRDYAGDPGTVFPDTLPQPAEPTPTLPPPGTPPEEIPVMGCTPGPGIVCGTEGDDYVELEGGAANTGGGDDVVVTYGGGERTIDTGPGADVITIYDDGTTTLDTGDGNDTVNIYGDGTTMATTGSGQDQVTIFGNGDTTLDTGEGDDIVTIEGSGTTTVEAGAGADTIIVNGGGTVFINGADGDDTIIINGDAVVIVNGGAGNDLITYDNQNSSRTLRATGTALRPAVARGPDVSRLAGGPGDDRIIIRGAANNIIISGGAGKDVLRGGSGNDRLQGGAGEDTLTAGRGKDHLWGGPGWDRCRGGPGRDLVFGCEQW